MKNYYLLFASGKDRPGLVAKVAETLFRNGCNLEDSSMMRLGGEFGIFLIFTSARPDFQQVGPMQFKLVAKKLGLSLSIKKVSKAEAQNKPPKGNLFFVKVMGEDKPGIVHQVCQFLFKFGFNISDLETHRTALGKKPGYILFVEGEFKSLRQTRSAQVALPRIQSALGIRIQIEPIPVDSI